MTWLAAFVGNGAAIDWILGLVCLEAVLLVTYRCYTRNGLRVWPILSLLLPGAFLLLTLRCALTNGSAVSMAALLLAAFVAHLADLGLRWRAATHGRFRLRPTPWQWAKEAGPGRRRPGSRK
jgi:hypothetical protein